MGRIKRAAEAEASEEPKAKKQKTEGDFDLLVEAYGKIASQKPKVKVDDLKDLLRWNRQVLKGTKDFVLFKVLDGTVNGRLGLCLLCGGKLKFMEDKEEMICCSGQFDESANVRIPCSFTDHRLSDKVPRGKFFISEPTEEENEVLDKLKEEAAKGPGGNTDDDNPVVKELLTKADDMDWKLTDKKGMQAASKELLELVQDKLALPEENVKMEIGRMILNNKDKSPREIVKLVIDRFGFAEAKKAKAEAREAAVEAACANPKNAAMLCAFQELAQLYFKGTSCFVCFCLLLSLL